MEKVALLEVLDRDGLVRQSQAVFHWPVSVGRSVQCDLVLDDPHLAEHHALLVADPDGPDSAAVPKVTLVLQGSINGAKVAGHAWPAGSQCPLHSGQQWQMGRTTFRLRLAQEVLPSEAPLLTASAASGWAVALVFLANLAWGSADAYLRSNPDGLWPMLWGTAVGRLAVLGVWALLWALATKLFQHRLAFWQHVWLACVTSLSVELVTFLLGMVAYALSLEWLGRLDALASAVALALLVNAHLGIVAPMRRRVSRWVSVGILGLMLVGTWGVNWYRQGQLSSELYLSALYPPAMRLVAPVKLGDFVEQAKDLQGALDKKAREPADGFNESPEPDPED